MSFNLFMIYLALYAIDRVIFELAGRKFVQLVWFDCKHSEN